MVKVLKDWNEIGESVKWLQQHSGELHEGPQKNWDHYLLAQIAKTLNPDAEILDLGCGRFFTLKLFYALGFRHLTGVDFKITWRAWLEALIFTRICKAWRLPFRVFSGDITKFDGRGRTYDLLACVSVIEHGVEMEVFFERCARLVKKEGILFVTTDYWEDSTFVQENAAYGLPWFIFNREQVREIIEIAKAHGFELLEGSAEIPACREKTVSYLGQDYTFLAMAFRKREI